MDATTLPTPERPLLRTPWVLRLGLSGAVLAAGLAFAWFAMFSGFREYDDEGYMMMSVRHMLDGRKLYDDVALVYGPAYYAWQWVLHGAMRVPLNHDAVRAHTLAVWLLTAGAMAWAVAREWRGSALAAGLGCICFAATVLHLKGLTNEPGHPQGLAALLVAGGLLAGMAVRRPGCPDLTPEATLAQAPPAARGHTAWALGFAGGLLLLVKLNVGVLFLTGSAVALLLSGPPGRSWGLMRVALVPGAVILPALVMKRHLDVRWGWQFCLVVTLGVLSCCMVAMRERKGPQWRMTALLWWAAGAIIAAAAAVGFALLRGSTPPAIVECLLSRALRFPEAFAVAIPMSRGGLWYAGAGTAAALICAFTWGGTRSVLDRFVVPAMKLILAAAVLAQCAGHDLLPGTAWGWHFDFAVPFLWLTLIVPPGRAASAGGLFLRRLITFVAALQVLQMYPVPGTQAMVGTAAIPAVAAIWLGDGLMRIGQLLPGGLMRWLPRLAWPVPALAAIGALGFFAHKQYSAWRELDRAHLAGFEWVRLPEAQAAVLRCLADTAAASADAIACNTGLNSLSFWSGHPPASRQLNGYTWDFLTDAEQEALVAQARIHPRLLYLQHDWFFDAPKREPVLVAWAGRELEAAGRVGAYTLRTRPGQPGVNWRSCAWRADRGMELEISLRGAAAPQRASFDLLDLSLPHGWNSAQITAVELVDLARNRIIAKTHVTRADKLVMLLDGSGHILLGDNQHRVAATVRGGSACKLAIPPQLDLVGCRSPAVRLYRQQTRLMTLPVVVTETSP